MIWWFPIAYSGHYHRYKSTKTAVTTGLAKESSDTGKKKTRRIHRGPNEILREIQKEM